MREAITVSGVVQTVFHAGTSFSAGRLRADDGAFVRFAGKLFVRENEPVSLRGHWEDHPKYGRQLTVDGIEAQTELDPAGLANYLVFFGPGHWRDFNFFLRRLRNRGRF